MAINIIITKPKNRNFKKELVFHKFPILIGRDSQNDIQLEDKNKIISRVHAKLINNNDIIEIIDLGSRNYTFLNSEKIKAQIGYALNENDTFMIGDYKFSWSVQIEKQNDILANDKTMLFSSPFTNEVLDLAKSLKKLSEKFSMIEDQLRDEYFKIDLLGALSQINFSNIGPLIADFFNDQYLILKKQKYHENSLNPNVVHSVREISDPKTENEQISKKLGDNFSFNSHLSNSFDILLAVVTKLIQGFWQFRQEFFGVTIYQSLPIESVEKLKEFLFDPSISDDESEKRLYLFKDELNKILSHQIGLLEGYKESFNYGIEKILDEMDPIILENKIKNDILKIGYIKIPYKYIPFYTKIKSLQTIKSTNKKLRLDISIIEKKHFRPAFIKGYQKRINTIENSE